MLTAEERYATGVADAAEIIESATRLARYALSEPVRIISAPLVSTEPTYPGEFDAYPTRLTLAQNLSKAVTFTFVGQKAKTKNGFTPKVCAACGLEFEWRKKWARDWEQVKFCSDKCRSGSKKA